jgi:hypothetical protein
MMMMMKPAPGLEEDQERDYKAWKPVFPNGTVAGSLFLFLYSSLTCRVALAMLVIRRNLDPIYLVSYITT